MEFKIIPSGSAFVKSAKYVPNPIVKYGIPSYADSRSNPRVKGTLAYQQWWEEQLYYIHNGYTTGGIHLPGRYYKFLNFDPVQSVMGSGSPEIHDFQLDYALWVEDLKKRRKNAFIPKARRKTVSVMTVGMVIDYGYRFLPDYHAAVVAGLDEYSQDFMDKWRYINAHMVPEFRLRRLTKNEDDVVAGWKEKQEGIDLEFGSFNTIYARTVNKSPNVLKGKFENDIIMEESGENALLLETIAASKDCLMFGNTQAGTLFVYGTGGNVNKGSKGFKKFYFDLEKYNAECYFIPARVFYHPFYAGAKDKHGNLIEDIPNLQHLKPEERVGMSDMVRAQQFIDAEKERLLKSPDLSEYFDYTQNNPSDIKEVFRKTATNNFPIIQLNDQGFKIESEPRKYGKFVLKDKLDDKGMMVMPREVVAEPASDDTPEKDCVLILHDGHPVKGYRFLYSAGIDSYDQDQSKISKSLGAMVVFIRQHSIPNLPTWQPVAIIRNRPDRKEKFYDMCLKLAIYYDLHGAVLIDRAKMMVGRHFQDAGCQRYLSYSPRKFESPNTKQGNEFGVSLNLYTKPRMVGVLQTFFSYHTEKVWFPQIIDEALDYDEYEDESDNDTVDALGIALMKAHDMIESPVDDGELAKTNPYEYPEWGTDRKGNIVDVTSVDLSHFNPKHEDLLSYQSRVGAQEDVDNEKADDTFSI